ncbi:MAG TPA: type II secretion system protein [Candidatus Wallbacteria bacterium]|nr:type II secretion system protein [Candidatus Wallbacteria bacterium]
MICTQISTFKTSRVYDGATARRRALTFVELMICVSVISIIAASAVALGETGSRLAREFELKSVLRIVRTAIDKYYDKSRESSPALMDNLHYPKSLNELVEKKYLRKLPVDPFTGLSDFRTISSTDEPDAIKTNGENLYDIKSSSDYTALDDSKVSQW